MNESVPPLKAAEITFQDMCPTGRPLTVSSEYFKDFFKKNNPFVKMNADRVIAAIELLVRKGLVEEEEVEVVVEEVVGKVTFFTPTTELLSRKRD